MCFFLLSTSPSTILCALAVLSEDVAKLPKLSFSGSLSLRSPVFRELLRAAGGAAGAQE